MLIYLGGVVVVVVVLNKFYTGTTGGDVFIFTYLVLKEDEGQHGYSGAW